MKTICSWLFLFCLCQSCAEDNDGLLVDVQVETSPPAAVIETNRGLQVRLTKAYLALGAVELLACDPPLARLWRELGLTSIAHAHSLGTPTRLGVPGVISLLSSGSSQLGVLAPPPGTYCAVRVELTAADGDALFLPTDAEMVGKSLFVEGVAESAAAAARPFSGVSDLPTTATLSIEPITLTGPHRLVLGVTTAGLFDDLDFADQEAVALGVLAQLPRTLRVTLR